MDTKNCKLRALSNECWSDFIGQSIKEIILPALFRHCLRPSKWRGRRPAGRNFRPYDKLMDSSEPPFDAESKLCTHFIVAQLTSELQPDFTSIPPLLQFEKLIAPNFRLDKDNMIDESPHANALAPRCFVPFTRCQNLNLDRNSRLLPILLSNDVYYRTKVPTTAKPSIQWQ